MNNLLSNAAKFSPRNSIVEIVVSEQNGNVRVNVKDKGIGIDEQSQPMIFEKFSQVDSTDERHSGGSRLGLDISRELVEKMGGEIGITSTIGKGSTFYLDRPKVQQVA